MTFKFEVELTGASQDEHDYSEDTPYTKRRVTVDNKYFTSIQVKDVSSILTDDCVLYIDSDTIPFMAASLQDDNYVVVSHPEWDEAREFKNKTEFKGASRTEGVITQKSWLGIENMKRAATGKPEYKLEDFTITQNKRLKTDEQKCLKNIKGYIDEFIEAIKFQSGCDNVFCYLGSGDNHRHLLKLPKIYKGNRDEQARPLLLKQAREYVLQNYPSELIVGREADDRIQQAGFEGWLHYKKTGKFNKFVTLIDKDGYQAPCLLFSYNKSGPIWAHPNPVLINSTNEGVGEIEMVGSDCKCTGLLQICYQLCSGDQSDFYHPYLRFDKELHPEQPYSDASFFKDFFTLKSPQECLQKVVDKFYDFFPAGLKYSAWDGTQMDIDTLDWLSMLFTCVYMLRSENDKTNIEALLNKFNVDYSKIVGNNKPKPVPLVSDEALRSSLAEYSSIVESVIALLSDKSGKVADKSARLEEALKMLGEIKNFDKLYES